MKKACVFMVVLAALALSSMADTLSGTIQWSTGVGVYWSGTDKTNDTEFQYADEEGILNNYSVLWQLIHTTDGEVHAPVFTNPNYLHEKDELVSDDSYRLGNASYFASEFGLDVSLWKQNPSDLTTPLLLEDSVESYYVYQRLFQLDSDTSIPDDSTPSWTSDAVDVRAQFDGMRNEASSTLEFKDGSYVTVPIHPSIPEPTTLSLLGLGALAMVLRRKLRK